MQKPFTLTDRLLLAHRAGALLCLSPAARGASFAMLAELPMTELRAARALTASTVAAPPPMDPEQDDDEPPSSRDAAGPMVAVVPIRGLLSSETSAWDCGMSDGYSGDGGIVERIASAMAMPNVSAVVLDVSSPGGDATGLGEAAAKIAAMRASSDKPLLCYARQACSAAYWLACAAGGDGGLFVSESSDVGNVGCWTAHVDYSAANEKDGVDVTYVADPAGKVLGNPDEPLADEAKARMQRGVSEVTSRFCAVVSSYRPKLTSDAVMKLDGDTRRGADAVAAGLADGVAGSLDDVVALAFARAMAARPPTITTTAGASTPNQQGIPMAYSKEIIIAAGLQVGASDAAVEAATLPLLTFATAALELLGEKDPSRAKGALAAKLEEASAAAGLRANLAVKAAETDAQKREKLVEDAVVAGKLRSGQAWDWSVDEKTQARVRAMKPFLARQGTAELEGYLEGLPALHRDASRTIVADESAAELAAASRVVPLTPLVARVAKKSGVDLNRLATATAQMFGGAPANEET